MDHVPHVLVVMSPKRRAELSVGSWTSGCSVLEADNCEQARQVLREGPELDVIISDLTLEDGNWWCICRELGPCRIEAEVIVALPPGGGDATAVFDHGAFGVLRPPFSSRQTMEMIQAACRARQRAMTGAAGVR